MLSRSGFGQPFYRWKNRYDPYDLRTLGDESCQPQTPLVVKQRILELRNERPRWGQEKLAVLLKRERMEISESTFGRVMNKLKARGLLVESFNRRQAKLVRRRRCKPHCATKIAKGYQGEAIGDPSRSPP
ncbi:MAG: helix-turn-helix domain-containing protein [Candidatus Aminicenantales bacterium]